jgi:hypothetical protein
MILLSAQHGPAWHCIVGPEDFTINIRYRLERWVEPVYRALWCNTVLRLRAKGDFDDDGHGRCFIFKSADESLKLLVFQVGRDTPSDMEWRVRLSDVLVPGVLQSSPKPRLLPAVRPRHISGDGKLRYVRCAMPPHERRRHG